MPDRMSESKDPAVSVNKRILRTIKDKKGEISKRQVTRLFLKFNYHDCFEELADLIGINTGSEVYCYLCCEVIDRYDEKELVKDFMQDTFRHLESIHGIVRTFENSAENEGEDFQ